MKKAFLILICLYTLSIDFTTAQEIFFTDNPCLTPDGNTIIFTYDGDLWKSSTTGGLASRITALDGDETRPRISPDGNWLAFTSNQYGNNDVYVMPLGGGMIKQLTYHESGDMVESWSWDSEKINFTSNRFNRLTSYSISINGETPKRLFGHYFNNIHNVISHPKSGEIYFNESWESSLFVHRQKYKGAYNPDVKSYNPKTGIYTKHTDYDGKDMSVTIDKNGHLYFVSDQHKGIYNLYKLENGKKTRLTNFNTPIYFPQVSANGNKIVFRKDYQIWVYDTKSKKSKSIPIQIVQNSTLERTQDFKVEGNITDFDVSMDGKKMAFVSRGELFVSDIKGQFVKQIRTAGKGRVSEVYWLKDNKSLIFNQTFDGYQNWYKTAADKEIKEKQLTSDKVGNRLMSMNSDRTKAVYLSGREEVRLMDLKSFESTTLVKEELWAMQNDSPQFGPDDKHVLFTAYRNFERDVFLLNTETKESKNLTKTGVSEVGPQWSRDGKGIYFISNRTQPLYPRGLRNAKIYKMPFDKYDKPFGQVKFDELFEDEESKKDSTHVDADLKQNSTEVQMVIELNEDGLMDRLERIGPRFGAQQNIYVYQKDEKTIVLYASNHDEGTFKLYKTTFEPFKSSKTEEIKGAKSGGFDISKIKDKHYIAYGGNIHTLNIVSGKVEKIEIKHTFRRQLRTEFEQMFEETWANVEENFYSEDFHGLDWSTTKKQYQKYLPYTSNRGDLRRLLNDMLGELNTSHFGFYSNGKEENQFFGTRTTATGIQFDNDNPFVVAHVLTDGPSDTKNKNILKGDVLIKVDGEHIDQNRNRASYFSKPSLDSEIKLTFKRGIKEVDVMLHPTSFTNQRTLLYDEWIDQRQAIVDEASKDRIAYVHMKNMGGGQLQQFLQEMVSELHSKDGLILDLRYNTGGNVHDDVLQFLTQQPYLQWKYRGGAMSSQPHFAPANKPIVLLTNEQSLSDAEMTAAGFKALDLGKVIGTETYRWIIFTSGKGLVDGSSYRLPSWGCYTLDGDNLEKTGVSPDIEIANNFKDRIEGNDPQLDRAIQEVLKQLK